MENLKIGTFTTTCYLLFNIAIPQVIRYIILNHYGQDTRY